MRRLRRLAGRWAVGRAALRRTRRRFRRGRQRQLARALVGARHPAMRLVHWAAETRVGRLATRLMLRTRLASGWAELPESPVEVVGRIRAAAAADRARRCRSLLPGAARRGSGQCRRSGRARERYLTFGLGRSRRPAGRLGGRWLDERGRVLARARHGTCGERHDARTGRPSRTGGSAPSLNSTLRRSLRR